VRVGPQHRHLQQDLQGREAAGRVAEEGVRGPRRKDQSAQRGQGESAKIGRAGLEAQERARGGRNREVEGGGRGEHVPGEIECRGKIGARFGGGKQKVERKRQIFVDEY